MLSDAVKTRCASPARCDGRPGSRAQNIQSLYLLTLDFFEYMSMAAKEMRLPIKAPNAVHAQLIAREKSVPREETVALSVALARQLMELPSGDLEVFTSIRMCQLVRVGHCR